MQVKNFMSRKLYILKPDNTVKETAELFLKQKIDGAAVLENGKLVGLLTKTHLIRSIAEGTDPQTAIKYLMTTKVATTSPDSDIRENDIMKTGRYPVVENGELVGMLTKSDIMVALNEIIDTISGQMEAVINSAYNPIVAIDKQGSIVIWNQAAEKMTNLNSKVVLGKFINEIIPESDLLKIVRTGESEYGVRLKIGSMTTITNRAPIIKNNEIIGAVAVLYDVSELEKVSRELEYVKELNAEMDAIIDSSFDGLYITDGNGMTIRINKAIKRITDLGENELLNKNMSELVDTGILSRSASLMVLEKKMPVTTSLTTITGKLLLVSATPVFDENGDICRIVTNVRDISELNRLKQKIEQLEELKNHFEFQMNQMKIKLSGNLVFKDQHMERLVYQAVKVAEVDSTVLITGESGVGKELIAEIIHENSHRKNGPYIKLNCAAIPENLLESELFGYEAGAFTGARKGGKPGIFELAHEGTLLLDEIGDVPIHLQVKLLRVIQEREIIRIGGTRPIKVDVRIIAVTNQDLENMIRQGQFREDLFYRLNVIPLRIPSLRERREDIPLLAHYFINKYNRRYGLNKSLDPDIIDVLLKYDWPGNIRQLENLVERLVVTTGPDLIRLKNLPTSIMLEQHDKINHEQPIIVNQIIPLKAAVETVEKLLLERTFTLVNSCHKAAEILEVNPSTISRKAHKYGMRLEVEAGQG
ncbi:PAS fold [Syntrophomonas zehnderi OL-4]|uniref:PAS fold n=1 Tax=Syntrophomonas zehnderi OL-4 TaxID=690567 RepID=A0A0E3W2F3_9FIRM|nr:sigma 54-interacting transcriptional regulator [Syntrophomonas zehnderi]CFW97189.1 PAS fold [Syntrophomonas zehnderi OL-4]